MTRIALGGRGGSDLMRLIKCLLSRIQEGSFSVRGWMKCVTNLDMLSVGLSHAETMGLRGMLGLWVFGRP